MLYSVQVNILKSVVETNPAHLIIADLAFAYRQMWVDASSSDDEDYYEKLYLELEALSVAINKRGIFYNKR